MEEADGVEEEGKEEGVKEKARGSVERRDG